MMMKHLLLTSVLLLSACDGMVGVKPATPVLVTQTCSIDDPVVNAKISAHKPFNVRGWIFDKQSATAEHHVRVQFTSLDRTVVKIVEASANTRPDVATVLKEPSSASSGFNVDIKPESLVAGTYDITVLLDTSNVVVACASKNTVVITE
jgi:hypothetical protein